jgi:hypothetical protein
MHVMEQLAAERVHDCLEQAREQRQARRQRVLSRTRRRERAAERRLIKAWRRADELRARLELPGY